MRIFIAMAVVVLGWVIVGVILIGLGSWLSLLFSRVAGVAAQSPDLARERDGVLTLADRFWLGLAGLVLVLQIVHFWSPITAVVFWCLAVVGIAGALHFVLMEERGVVPPWSSLGRMWLIIAAFLAVWIANRAIGPGDAHDSGLYHFNVIRWSSTYPVVPGLGNLAPSLALNSSSLLYESWLRAGPLGAHAHHVANSALVVMLGFQSIVGLRRLLGGGRAVMENALRAMALPVVVMLAVSKGISSPKTDLPVGVMTIAAMIMLARLLAALVANCAARNGQESKQTASRAVDVRALAFAACIVCAALPCLKLSAAVIGLAIWIIAALVGLYKASGAQSRATIGGLALTIVLSALLIGAWMGRNVVLSGYPLYPTQALAIDAEWRMPETHITLMREAITDHAKGGPPLFISQVLERTPLRFMSGLIRPPFDAREDVEGLNWIRPWFFTLPFAWPVRVIFPAALAALFLALGWLARRRGSSRAVGEDDQSRAQAWWLWIPVLLGGIVWLLLGPSGRFGWPLFWSGAGIALGLMLATGGWRQWVARHRVLVSAVLIAVSIVPVIVRGGMVKVLYPDESIASVLVWGPGDGGLGFHATPTARLGIYRTSHDLPVWVPVLDEPELVWDSPIPACPWPPVDPWLRARDPDDLSRGFMIDRPADVPNPYPTERHDPEPAEPIDR